MIDIIFKAFRNKTKYVLYILMLLIMLSFYYIVVCIDAKYTYEINNVLGAEEINRGLIVYSDDIDDYYNSNENIISYYPIYSNLITNNITINVYRDYEILTGRYPSSDNEIVISKYYFNILELTNEEILNTISIDILNKSYNIVGVTSKNDINIYMTEDNFTNINTESPDSYYILIDTYENVFKVQEELQKLGYYSELYDSSGLLNIEKIENIQNSYKYVLVFSLITLNVVICLIIKNIIKNEDKNIALLRAIGFKKRKISIILFIRVFLILSCTLLISTILVTIINYCFLNYDIINYILLTWILSLLILFLNFIFFRYQITKLNPIEILNT